MKGQKSKGVERGRKREARGFKEWKEGRNIRDRYKEEERGK